MTKFLQEVRTTNEASWVVQWLTQAIPRWRRPPSLILEKYINNSGLDKDICTKFHGKTQQGCTDDHVTKSRNRKLIRVTSSNEGLKHMCVDLSQLFEPNFVQNTNTTLPTCWNGQIHITENPRWRRPPF